MVTLCRPVEVKYRGLDADEHKIDAVYLGQSLVGTGRLYNSIADTYFHGEAQRTRRKPIIRVQVGPPTPGTLTYLIWLILVHGQLPMYPQVLCDLAELVLPEFVRAIFWRKAGKKPEMEKALEVIEKLADHNQELSKLMLQESADTKHQLIRLVDRLTTQNAPALSEIAAPVGRTVKQLEHFAASPKPFVIDEPIAEAFRAKVETVVGEEEKLTGVLVAVDTVSGACKVRQTEDSKPFRAKITDPALKVPENVYTHALDTGKSVELVGKPVIKEGELSTFYISNAKPLE